MLVAPSPTAGDFFHFFLKIRLCSFLENFIQCILILFFLLPQHPQDPPYPPNFMFFLSLKKKKKEAGFNLRSLMAPDHGALPGVYLIHCITSLRKTDLASCYMQIAF